MSFYPIRPNTLKSRLRHPSSLITVSRCCFLRIVFISRPNLFVMKRLSRPWSQGKRRIWWYITLLRLGILSFIFLGTSINIVDFSTSNLSKQWCAWTPFHRHHYQRCSCSVRTLGPLLCSLLPVMLRSIMVLLMDMCAQALSTAID